MNSFISWIGGKKLLRKKILEAFPEPKTFERYIEVFGGAGWVLFSTDRHAELEVYNDINGYLVNLFRCAKYHPDALQKELEFTLMSREQFFDAKEQIKVQGLTDIQKAARFFILIKESYGTNLRDFKGYFRNMKNAVEYICEVSERLSTVVIENQDFEQILKTYDRTDALFYLDPPYHKAEKYYLNDFTKEDHIRLKKSLEKVIGKFILSYNDSKFIRELYSDYYILEVDRAHNLNSEKEKPRYKELIIKNF